MIRFSDTARFVRGALAVGAVTAASSLFAVQAQEQAQATAEQSLQTVVVTGSIIKRTDFETPSPVQVMTSEDLQQSGYTSVSDVLRNLSANGQGTLSQSFNFAFAGGGAGVALRGLTVGGTLTLVDGQRMIPYPLSDDSQRNFVDVSSIPFNVIDHIDVLKDGASAEYGSDAIAGVVNVVFKKTFTGASVTANVGTSQKGDGTTEQLAGIWGTGDLASNGYNAYLSVEYRHSDNILVSNRSGLWTTRDWTPYGGFNTIIGADDPNYSTRPRIIGGYVLNPATNTIDSTTHFLDPNACNYAAFTENKCEILGRDLKDQLQPQTGNLNILGRFTKNFGGTWQFVFTPSLFRSESEQVLGAGNTGVSSASFTNFGYGPGVNPFPVVSPPIMLAANNPNNPFGVEAPLVARYFPQLGTAQTQFVTDTYRVFGEFTGNAAGWDIDANLGWMYAALTQKSTGFINRTELAATALTTFNFATATTQQMESAFAQPGEVKDTNEMEVVDLHATRELMQMSGGPLAMAVGIGYNHLYKNSLAPPAGAAGVQGFNAAYVVGGQSNDNAYLEFNAPVLKGLEIDAAVRYDRYPQYGSSTTPKFGVKYAPFDMLTFRGTYGKGFRAPNPAEAGTSGAAFGGAAIFDTALCPDPTNPRGPGSFPNFCGEVTGLQTANSALQPEKSTNWTAGLIFTPWTNTSISFDYWDIKVNQDIQSGVSVLILGGNAALFPNVYGPQVVDTYCTAQNVCNGTKLTPAPGPILYIDFPYYNLTQTHVNGLDVDLASHFDIGKAGRLTATFNGSYMFHYDFGLGANTYDLAGTHGPSIISGDTGNPKIRAVASLGWDEGPWNLTASVNYVGRFNLTDPTAGEPDCLTAIEAGGVFGGRWGTPNAYIMDNYCEVHSFTTVDLYGKYAFTKNLDVHGSILNLFGQEPPLDMTTYGAPANLAYNPAMHQAGAVGRFFNVGVTFTF